MSGDSVKSTDVDEWAGLWMRIDGLGKETLGFDNMEKRPMKGTTTWTTYKVVLDVPKENVHVAFGVMLSGKGEVGISAVVFEETTEDVTSMETKKSYPEQPGNLAFTEE